MTGKKGGKRTRKIQPPKAESLTREITQTQDPQGWNQVRQGKCNAAVCAPEAACKIVSEKLNLFTCICPHDETPAPPDNKCTNSRKNKLVPVNTGLSKPIPVSVENRTPSSNATDVQISSFRDFSVAEAGIALAVITSFLLLISFLCCWKWKKLQRCCSFQQKLSKSSQNGLPLSLSKGLLATDRYAPNPQYSPCSISDLTPSLPVPTLTRDHVTLLQEIGEGCFGKVYKGEYKTETQVETVAIKVLKDSASKEAEEDFMREVEIMSVFIHCNILTLYGVVPREPNKSPWMVFEFMPHGDLTEVLRSNSRKFWPPNSTTPRLNKESLLRIATQIANGMAYLAAQRFVHRDLACRNCLVGENLCVKIADFGMSRDVYTCDYYKMGGSRLLPVRWMSPESVVYGRFTLESDVWSYGVVLWEIYSLGKQPYFGHTNEEVVKLILQGVMLLAPEDCPPFICELMKACWKTEAKDRITFFEILEKLQLASMSTPVPTSSLPRPPAFPVTPLTTTEVLDAENYLKPLPTEPREYLQTLPDIV